MLTPSHFTDACMASSILAIELAEGFPDEKLREE